MVISCGLVEKERMIIKTVEKNHGLCLRYNYQIEGFLATSRRDNKTKICANYHDRNMFYFKRKGL